MLCYHQEDKLDYSVFDATVTNLVYLKLLQMSAMRSIREDFEDEPFYLLSDGVPLHYQRDVEFYLDEILHEGGSLITLRVHYIISRSY